jgi:dTDP-4-dehydrorhamnose 3,5-epimerase
VKVEAAGLGGLALVHPVVHEDERGSFRETWSSRRYRDAGFPAFVQDNLVRSGRGVLRGLHFQYPAEQAKLVAVIAGEIYDVAVDVRISSPTFGRWTGFRLSEHQGAALYVPAGFAHGYAVVSETAVVMYKCSDYYDPDSEGSVLWSDPALGISWPFGEPRLSAKDRQAPLLRDIPADRLPRYSE